MKARITHLKAPWPSGALVGAIVAFVAGAIPAWAVGKCVPAGEDEEVEYVIEPAQPVGERAATTADPLAELRAQAEAHFERMKAEHAAQLAELNAKLAEADERLELAKQVAVTANDNLRADLDASQAKLSEAMAANAALVEANAATEARLAAALAAVPKGKAK